MKTIFITGGADGLGKELAKKLLSDPNNTVVVSSRSIKRVQSIQKELGCDAVLMDVTNVKSIALATKKILKKHKKIDCLINNAGIWTEGAIDTSKEKDIRDTININLIGLILVTRAVVPHMKKNGSGIIININSQNGLVANKERSIYTASKWGVTGFTKSLQSELAKFNISVTGLYPGKMNTSLFKKAGVNKPMHDAVDVEEVADVIQFLLSKPNNVLITDLGIKSILH